jgi:hypothetical protein
MSTLRVDSIENGGAAVNFTTDLAIGAGKAIREYYAQSGEPSGAGNGAVWWDTTNSVYKLLIEGEWYTVGLVLPPPPFVGSRGIFAGGGSNYFATSNVIEYITIPTPGNATDFGDLTVARFADGAAVSNGSRAVFGRAIDSGTAMDYITIATLGNATFFGNSLTPHQQRQGGCSDGTYGVFGGGYTFAGAQDAIHYITIATLGDALDFGDLTQARMAAGAAASVTRGLFFGGRTDANSSTSGVNTIDYVTIATPGNATDFGDLTVARWGSGSTSDGFTALTAGGYGSANSNVIDYVTIATAGNAIDFGDLTIARNALGACSDGVYATFAGGETNQNVIDYVTVATPGNATDFGDLTRNATGPMSCSGN